MLAEKITSAITLGPANIRVRDYVDIYTLTGRHDLTHAPLREALLATAEFRGTPLEPLSSVVDNLVDLRRATYNAYRASLATDGDHLPENFGDIIGAVAAFADPLVEPVAKNPVWKAAYRRWNP